MFDRIVLASVGTASQDQLTAAGAKLWSGNPTFPLLRFTLDGARPGDGLDELLHFIASTHAELVVLEAGNHVTARRVTMLAPCSVLIVPNNTEPQMTRLLIPVDFSEASSEAVREGCRLALATGGEGVVVAVESDDDPWLDWHDQPHHLEGKLQLFVREAAGPHHQLTCLVEPVRHSTMALGHGLHQAPHNIEGADIASTIVSVAGRLQSTLIVMGTRGRTPAASILIGSVTEKVVQLSPVPVFAVKQPGERLGLLKALVERLRGQSLPLVVG